MEPSTYVGRKVQKHILKSLLSAAFRKNTPQSLDEAVPRLFLFYGENGTGKSSLVDLCMQNVAEISAETGKPAFPLLLDLDAWRFRNGTVPKTVRSMLDALYAVAAGTNEKFAARLAPFEQASRKINEVENARSYYTRIEWPREAFPVSKGTDQSDAGEENSVPGSNSTAADTARFQSWLEHKVNPADLAMCISPEETLTEALANGLVSISLEFPFVICIDSLELAATPEIEEWLRNSFLPYLVTNKSRIAVVIAGACPFVRQFRNSFPEAQLYPLSLTEASLSSGDIAELAVRKGLEATPELVGQIEHATGGVPIIAQAVLDYVKLQVPIGDVLPEKALKEHASPAELVQEAFDKFMLCTDDTVKMRIFSLAMLYRFDENILAQLWGITAGEVMSAIAELAAGYPSFMQGDRLQGTIRDLARSFIITDEATRTSGSAPTEFLKKFASINSSFYNDYLSQMRTRLPDAVQRYADPGYQITLCGMLSSLVLSSQQEALRLLPGFFVEALHYNPDFAPVLLGFADEFRPLLTQEFSGMLDQLRSGLDAAPIIKAPVIPGERADAKLLDSIVKHAAGMSETQKGLLHRLKGVIACHAGNFSKAMEEFNKSAEFLESSATDRTLLFENFLCAGYAFLKTGKNKKAVDAFEKAVAINPDDFYAWFEMAHAQQTLGDHKAAIGSYSEAVRISADAEEAWFELGNEYAVVSEHGHAVEAFTHAAELGPDRPAVWFNLGISLEALARYPEAQNALQKSVAMAPDSWEALFALGRSMAAQSLTAEAIDCFNKTVVIKPDCTDAWKALGRELLTTGAYEKAASALEKGAERDTADVELWYTIGKAWLGAEKYENAVIACQKAVDLKKDFFDAWVALGQGFTALNDFKGACSSFTTAAGINSKDREIWVSVGNSLYAQGKYPQSIDAYLKATELRDDADGIWHCIGLAYQVQGKFSEAVESFRKSIDINPSSADVWYQQGRSYAELEKHAEAAESFSKTVELTPDAHDAWFRKGLSCAKAGNHVDAIPAFIKAAELFGTDADIWYQMGLSYVATGNAADAVQVFVQSIEQDDKRSEVHYHLGLARESLGNYEEAIPAYHKAAELSPENVEPWLHLGLCCNSLQRYAEAAEALRKVLEIQPGNKDVYLPMAIAAHAVGEYGEAVGYYRKVIEHKPDSQEALYNCALALHAMNDHQEALKLYRKVVQKWPSKDQAWYNMGLAYHALADYKQAVTAYREAARLNPESPEIWYQLGMVFYVTEQYGEAILAFRKVTSRRTDMYEAWYNLGNSYLIWREFNDAVAAYVKATEIRPDDFSAWAYLASAYYSTGTYDKAEAASAKAYSMKPDEPSVLCTLGLSKVLRGDAAGAAPLFETLLSADTTGQEIGRAASELQAALGKNPKLAGAAEILQKLTGGN